MSGGGADAGATLDHYVRVYDDALDGALCEGVVDRFERDAPLHKHVDHRDVRRFTSLDISLAPGWADVTDTLLTNLLEYERRYVHDTGTRWIPPEQAYEHFRIKRYAPGGGDRFRVHVDIANATNARRFLVAFWYLNDVAEGGETEFPTLGLAVPPRRGRMLLFPPAFLYPHQGNPPVSDPKYIVGSYLLYV